jgi:ABC-type nitrate/sulfonate/bicarbonate transport system substrate-binding protein
MISGSVETCQTGTTTGTDAIAEGAAIKGIAVIIGPISEIVLSAKTVARLAGVSPASPLADRVRALKGLRLVSSGPGTAHYVTLDAMMKKAGMGIGDIKFRTLGDTIAMMESIRNDQIDGAMWTVGMLAGVIVDKSGVRWINVAGGDVPEFRGVPYVTTYAQTAWVEKNPDLVNRVHEALADATAAMKKDPARYSRLLKEKYFPQMDQALWDESYRQGLPSLLDGARAPKAGWEYLLQLQAENTMKDYSRAAWDKALIQAAQAK